MNSRRGLRIGFAGFVLALIGALGAFVGFEIQERWLSLSGFLVVVSGVAIGFIGIVYSWVTEGKQAVAESFGAAKKLSDKIKGGGGKEGHG